MSLKSGIRLRLLLIWPPFSFSPCPSRPCFCWHTKQITITIRPNSLSACVVFHGKTGSIDFVKKRLETALFFTKKCVASCPGFSRYFFIISPGEPAGNNVDVFEILSRHGGRRNINPSRLFISSGLYLGRIRSVCRLRVYFFDAYTLLLPTDQGVRSTKRSRVIRERCTLTTSRLWNRCCSNCNRSETMWFDFFLIKRRLHGRPKCDWNHPRWSSRTEEIKDITKDDISNYSDPTSILWREYNL